MDEMSRPYYSGRHRRRRKKVMIMNLMWGGRLNARTVFIGLGRYLD